MLISIDHGNKQIKTTHRTFVSGLRESDTRPSFGKEMLFYNSKYYTLTDQRIRQYPKVAVLDIGGFTADYLLVKNGEADLSACDSLDNGVITL